MATLTQQIIDKNGIAESLVAAGGSGDACEAGEGRLIKVNNANAGTVTVTLAIPASAAGYSQQTYSNKVVSIPTGQIRWIKVGLEYKDPTTGLATVTCSPAASVTVGAFTVPQG